MVNLTSICRRVTDVISIRRDLGEIGARDDLGTHVSTEIIRVPMLGVQTWEANRRWLGTMHPLSTITSYCMAHLLIFS